MKKTVDNNTTMKPLNQNKMGILRDQTNKLKNDSWYKKLRRWLKFKLWICKHKLNKSE